MSDEPLAYRLGYVDFYNLHLEVNPDVLIPRNETEILADKVIARMKKRGKDSFTAVDLCTGTGCLGLTIKSIFPNARVILIDICEKALDVAKKNAKRNHLEVEFLCQDALESYQGPKIDLFLSNPPYVTDEEYELLDPSVKNYEPKKALVGGVEGLDIYQKISNKLYPLMNDSSLAAFEIGYQQREGFHKIFSVNPWKSIQCEKDWSGHDRFFFLEK